MSHRTQITLTKEQYDLLREESQRTGVSLAELIRRAVDGTYGSVARRAALDALDESFGSWEDQALDGEHYVDALRRGMAQRLADG